jgi:hypothetical protein
MEIPISNHSYSTHQQPQNHIDSSHSSHGMYKQELLLQQKQTKFLSLKRRSCFQFFMMMSCNLQILMYQMMIPCILHQVYLILINYNFFYVVGSLFVYLNYIVYLSFLNLNFTCSLRLQLLHCWCYLLDSGKSLSSRLCQIDLLIIVI